MYAIAVTAIILKDKKILITKRSSTKSKWPSKWTVPGGNLEDKDFIGTPTEINNQWYNTLENCVKRETKEEVNLEITNIKYLCNIAIPGCVILSYTADYLSGEIVLQEEECSEYAWVDLDTLKDYDFIDGLEHEIQTVLENIWNSQDVKN